ncbi:MAG: cupin domain-containing protein [Vicinamibacterales bacterium]
MNRSMTTFALVALLWGGSGTLLHGQVLMQEPLGETTEPKMALFTLSLAPGRAVPSHQYAGVVFAYVLEGAIENLAEPGQPRIHRAGDFFHERPGQVHRTFRNLSETTPAKILVLQNAGTLPPGVKPLLHESLTDLTNQEISLTKNTTPPGGASPGPHKHSGPVFAYLVKGEVESQVEPGEPTVYRSGEVFYEPPLHTHRFYRNLSKTEPAELLVFQVVPKGQPRTIRVD